MHPVASSTLFVDIFGSFEVISIAQAKINNENGTNVDATDCTKRVV
jgi:hypothetical protein